MSIEYFQGTPPSHDRMWAHECASVADYCTGRGIDVGAGQRTLFEDTVRVDCFPDSQPDYVADAMHLPFTYGEWDYVFTCHVLEHMANPRAALQEWLRVVKVGGVVASIIPDTRYTRGQNTDRTPHYFEWAPEEFITQVLGWGPPPRREPEHPLGSYWFNRTGPLEWAPARVESIGVACPGWSFHVVLRRM